MRGVRAVRAWAIALVVAIALPASADPLRVLVVDFEGDKARPVQAAIVTILTDASFTVESDASKEVDARLTGSLVRNRRKHFILTVKISDKLVSTLDIGRSGVLGKSDAATLRRQLVAYLNALPPKPKEEAPPKPQEPAEVVQPQVATSNNAAPPAHSEPVPPVKQPDAVIAAPHSGAQPAFENFALVRDALPENILALRGYWDTRKVIAAEQTLGFRGPFELDVFARTTMRSNAGSSNDLTTFQVEGSVWSPMVMSLGAVVVVDEAAGDHNLSIRPGLGQTLLFSSGPVRFVSMLALTPYDSRRPGGGVTEMMALTVGPVRSEVYVSYSWAELTKPLKPAAAIVRPDLRVRIWNGLGIFGQYEYNNSVPIGIKGFRVGAELSGRL